MPARSEDSVRRELAHYMKAELGMNVKIPPEDKSGASSKLNGSGKQSATLSQRERVPEPGNAAAKPPPTATTTTPRALPTNARNHKARERDRKRAMRSAATSAQPEPPVVPDATSLSSTNRNTLKNKRRRAKEREERLDRAKQRAATSSSSSPSELAAASVDPSVKNNTIRPQPAAPAAELTEHERRLQAQRQSEANSAKIASMAAAFEAGRRWWTHPQCVYTPSSSAHTVMLDAQAQARLQAVKDKAQSLLSAYARSVKDSPGEMSREDERWLSSIMQSGTLSDKVAGMQLLLQDRCMGRLDVLERLLQMAGKKGRRESSMAMDALKELFLSELMPPDRPLLFFSHQPALHGADGGAAVDDGTLLYWLFEDGVKRAYTAYLVLLEQHLHDTMSYIKKHAINTLFSLLAAIPEREKTVLTLLVNKLGDPDRKIASRVVFLLSELTALHPALRVNVVKELEAFLFRAGVSERGQYYAIIWLNQMRFGPADGALARSMVQLYFAVFAMEVHRAEALKSKLLGGILTGINRAMPYARGEVGAAVVLKDSQVDLLFSLTHTAAVGTCVQALMLLWQVVSDDVLGALASRYYRALYDMLRTDGVGVGSKVTLFLNLLYRSMKGDESDRRVGAFAKRLLQVATGMSAGFLCGCLYLLSEVMQRHPALRTMLQQGDMVDDEDEHFVDVKDEDDAQRHHQDYKEREKDEGDETADDAKDNSTTATSKQSFKHVSPINGVARSRRYDANKREPLYANAQHSALWELSALLHHYHPSVQSWTRLLLSSSAIRYEGDPLLDFTPAAFLDRFVFRNPKQHRQTDKPALVASSHLQRGGAGAPRRTAEQVAVSSKRWLQKREEDVREDELFYWRYFKEKERREQDGVAGTKKKKEKTAATELADDEEAMDAFADRVMEDELLRAAGGEPDAQDEDELLDALKVQHGHDEDHDLEELEVNELTAEQLAEMDGLEDVSVDEDEEERAAAELELDADDDELPTFSDDESDDSEDEDEDKQQLLSGRQKKKLRLDGAPPGAAGVGGATTVFASAEEFADILAEGTEDTLHRKDKQRQFTHDRAGSRGRARQSIRRRR